MEQRNKARAEWTRLAQLCARAEYIETRLSGLLLAAIKGGRVQLASASSVEVEKDSKAASNAPIFRPAEGSTSAASGCTRNTRKRDFHPIKADGSRVQRVAGMLESPGLHGSGSSSSCFKQTHFSSSWIETKGQIGSTLSLAEQQHHDDRD